MARKKPRAPAPRAMSDDASKGELIRFRCTAEQRDLMIAAARAAGLDVSSWLRMVALREARAASGAGSVTPPTPEPARR